MYVVRQPLWYRSNLEEHRYAAGAHERLRPVYRIRKKYEQVLIDHLNVLGFIQQPLEMYAFLCDTDGGELPVVNISLQTDETERARQSFFEMIGRSDHSSGMRGPYLDEGPISEYAPLCFEFYATLADPDNDESADRLRCDLIEQGAVSDDIRQWFRVTVGFRKPNTRVSRCLRGVVALSISPYYIENVYLSWDPATIQSPKQPFCADTYLEHIAEQESIKEPFEDSRRPQMQYINSVLAGLSNAKRHARVFSVGQASFNYIVGKGSTSSRVAFDVGGPVPYFIKGSPQHEKSALTRNRLITRYMVPSLVILSHWHFDHASLGFGLAYRLVQTHAPTIWIAPDQQLLRKRDNFIGMYTIPQSIIGLRDYLLACRKLCLVQNSSNSKTSQLCRVGDCRLMMGAYPLNASKRGDYLNNSGILLSVGDALFTGDCGYDYWPDYLRARADKFNSIVIPHHGYDISNNRRVFPCSPSNRERHCYISVGNNTYGHPALSHEKQLSRCGFIIHKTNDLINPTKKRYWYEFDIPKASPPIP